MWVSGVLPGAEGTSVLEGEGTAGMKPSTAITIRKMPTKIKIALIIRSVLVLSLFNTLHSLNDALNLKFDIVKVGGCKATRAQLVCQWENSV